MSDPHITANLHNPTVFSVSDHENGTGALKIGNGGFSGFTVFMPIAVAKATAAAFTAAMAAHRATEANPVTIIEDDAA